MRASNAGRFLDRTPDASSTALDENMHALKPKRAALALVLTLAFFFAPSGHAQDTFVIEDIRLEGLQRISPGTVFNYLPLQIGDEVDSARSAEAIHVLFQTGFFEDVRLEREGGTLLVSLVERPSIASVDFEGNRTITTEVLSEQLNQIDFAVGRVFNRSVFDRVEQELRRAYFASGRYGVRIQSTVTPLERNRVAVHFDISEGRVAKIKRINVVGNHAFEEEDLLDLFELGSTGLWSVFTRSDQYSKQKLAADLEALRSHYLDRGFVNFTIDSTQVSITPDKKDVYITINVTEGGQFRVSEVQLGGELLVDESELFERVKIRRGDVFSRTLITETTTSLAKRLGDEGYAFANINAVPQVDEAEKEVALTFFIDPGQRVYVRRINFSGNTETRDEVLRREMRQMEGAWMSTSAIARSRERLERLGYFERVSVETPPVPGTSDQVDLDFDVVEVPSGNLSFGAGLSQDSGVILSSELSHRNFLGSGNRLSLVFNNSKSRRNFSFSWFNPYYTDDGVSRGFQGAYRITDASERNLADYSLDELSGGFSFGFPVSEYDAIDLRVIGGLTEFETADDASREVRDFEELVGRRFTSLRTELSWSTDSRDNIILPRQGSLTAISGEAGVPVGELTYYKLVLRHQHFIPLPRDFIFAFEGELGYGDGYGDFDDLPLIHHFYAGGPRSVRGFESNTLGPRDSLDDPLGGSVMFAGQTELVVPMPFIASNQFRFAAFWDFGQVYSSADDFDFEELRTSTGVAMKWISPLGPMSFSLAYPINDESSDETQPFQFSIGTTF